MPEFLKVTALVLGLIFIALLLAPHLPNPFLPGYVGIRGEQAATQVLDTMASTLGTILAILVAITLLGFELFQQGYRTYALRLVFGNPRIAQILALYVLTILFCILTLLFVEAPLYRPSISVIYTCFLLFVVCLFTVFPYCRLILSPAYAKDHIRALVSNITESSMLPFSRYGRPRSSSEVAESLEVNPIFVLSELGIRTIRDRDRLTPKLIVGEAEARLIEMLKAKHGDRRSDRREAINGMLPLVQPLAQTAIDTRSQGALFSVLQFFEAVHSYGAKEHFAYHEFIELDEFIADLLDSSLKQGLTVIVTQGIYMLSRVALAHLRDNVPAEGEISAFRAPNEQSTTKHDPEKELQWSNLSTRYADMIKTVGETAGKHRQTEVSRTASFALADLQHQVLELSLGELQKKWILRWLSHSARQMALSVAWNGIDDTLSLMPYDSSSLHRMFEEFKPYAKEMLIEAGRGLTELAELGALTSHALNDFAAFGRGLTRGIEHGLMREALIFVIHVLGRIRTILEPGPTLKAKRLYLDAYEQIQSLRTWLGTAQQHDEGIRTLIEEELALFTKYEEFKQEDEKRELHWPASKPQK